LVRTKSGGERAALQTLREWGELAKVAPRVWRAVTLAPLFVSKRCADATCGEIVPAQNNLTVLNNPG
jgi:hypothetical protein